MLTMFRLAGFDAVGNAGLLRTCQRRPPRHPRCRAMTDTGLLMQNAYQSDVPSGENAAVVSLAALLRRRGLSVRRLTVSNDTIPGGYMLRAGVAVRSVWSRRAQAHVSEVIRDFQPSVVHVHNTFPLLSPSVLQSAARHARVVVTIHNYRLACANGLFVRDGATCTDCLDRRLPLPAVRHCASTLGSGVVAMDIFVTGWRRPGTDTPTGSSASLDFPATHWWPPAWTSPKRSSFRTSWRVRGRVRRAKAASRARLAFLSGGYPTRKVSISSAELGTHSSGSWWSPGKGRSRGP